MRTDYKRDLEIIKAYKNTDMTMREVGELFNISKQAVLSVIHKYKNKSKRSRRIFIYFNGQPVTLLRTY